MSNPEKKVLTITEFITALGISRPTYYGMVERGEVKVNRAGRRVLIPKAELEKLVN